MLPSARKASFSEVPIVDLAPAFTDGDAGRRIVADAIADAAGRVGFFYVKNHGVALSDISDIFRTAMDFHELPLAAKMESSMTLNNHAQGYLHGMTKGNDANLNENLQEAFQIRRPLAPDDPDLLAGKPLHGRIPWPSAMPDLQPRMMAYYEKVDALGYRLLDLFEMALELEPGAQYFTDRVSRHGNGEALVWLRGISGREKAARGKDQSPADCDRCRVRPSPELGFRPTSPLHTKSNRTCWRVHMRRSRPRQLSNRKSPGFFASSTAAGSVWRFLT